MARELLQSIDSMRDIILFRDIKLLLHLLVPLFIHGIAQEICSPLLMELISKALCPAQSTCSEALYLNNLQQTVAAFLMIPVLILLCELSDEYGRKPFLLLTTSTTIFPVGLAWTGGVIVTGVMKFKTKEEMRVVKKEKGMVKGQSSLFSIHHHYLLFSFIFLSIVPLTIAPNFALLAINKSRGFIYAYFALRCLSHIISMRSVFCIATAYAADVVEDEKRVAAFSWITGVMSASHVVGSVLAKFLPENYSFELSLLVLVVCPIFIQLFVTETVIRAPVTRQKSPRSILFKLIKERYSSMRYAATAVMTRPSLRGIYLVSFLYEFGMSGISSVLLLYLKQAFDLKGSNLNTLMVVQIGAVFSQMLLVPVINGIAGEKAILCMGLLASATYAVFYSVAWEAWLPYISVSLGLANGFVKPSLCAIVSRSSSSNNQGRAQGSLAAIEAIAGFISPFVMTPLTMWFMSHNAPFDFKGFSILCAALSMMVAMFCAMQWKPEATWNHDLKDVLLT